MSLSIGYTSIDSEKKGLDLLVGNKCLREKQAYHLAENQLELRVRVIGTRGNILISKTEPNTLVKLFQNLAETRCIHLHKLQQLKQLYTYLPVPHGIQNGSLPGIKFYDLLD